MMTVHEFWEFSNRPEHYDHTLELLHGEVIEWELPYLKHGIVCARIGFILNQYAVKLRIGFVTTNNVGLIFPKTPASVLGPDVSYFAGSFAEVESSTGWDETLPLIAVEVHSTNHDERIERVKIDEYLRHDIAHVWYIDYEEKTLAAYRPDRDVIIHGAEDELVWNAELDIIRQERFIPELRFRVGDLFRLPAESSDP